MNATATAPAYTAPDATGHFGPYGGAFIPEVLIPATEALTEAYAKAQNDPTFQAEYEDLLRTYVGRPTALTFANRLTGELGRGRIYLKREDLCHTGAHKVNNTIGRSCWPGAWAKRGSSPRPEPGNTA